MMQESVRSGGCTRRSKNWHPTQGSHNTGGVRAGARKERPRRRKGKELPREKEKTAKKESNLHRRAEDFARDRKTTSVTEARGGLAREEGGIYQKALKFEKRKEREAGGKAKDSPIS